MKPCEVIAVLRRNGFVERKSRRGHRQFVRTDPPPKRRVTVPVHPGDLRPKTLRSVIIQSGTSADEFHLIAHARLDRAATWFELDVASLVHSALQVRVGAGS